MRRLVIILVLSLAVVAFAGGELFRGTSSLAMSVGTDTTSGGNSYGSKTVSLVGSMVPYASATALVVIRPSYVSTHDLGESDSAFGVFYTTKRGIATVLDADTCAALPCSCLFASAMNDTLFGENLYFEATVRDTVNDTTFTASYPIFYDVIVRGR